MNDRDNSIAEYQRKCPATAYRDDHDWRYASSAPGWRIGIAAPAVSGVSCKALRQHRRRNR